MKVSRGCIYCKPSCLLSHCLNLSITALSLCICTAAINLVLDLKNYDVRPMLLSGLVALLNPLTEGVDAHEITQGDTFVWMFAYF